MIAIPAVDLRDGACVQLVGGDYAEERVRLDDPSASRATGRATASAAARRRPRRGHGARDQRRQVVRDILRDSAVPVQVGGGVRDEDAIERLLDDGADAVVVGTRAVEDEDWRRDGGPLSRRLIVAADVRERQVVTRGWAQTLPRRRRRFRRGAGGAAARRGARDRRAPGRPDGGHRPAAHGGRGGGERVPVLASGGVTSMDDLRALEHRGLAGAVIGMALYTGALDAARLAEEFGA